MLQLSICFIMIPQTTSSILLVATGFLCSSIVSKATTIIHDSFDSVPAGEGLAGRNPDINLTGGSWRTNSFLFAGNNNGGLDVSFTNSRNAFFELEERYFANNPGLYQLSISINSFDDPSSQTWFGMGFTAAQSNSTSLAHTDNLASPWFLYRHNGDVNVYAGPITGNLLTNGTGVPDLRATTGVTHTFALRLDTTGEHWTLQLLIDGVAADLGPEGSPTYTYATNPEEIRYLMISTGNGGAGNTAITTIDDFRFELIPEPSALSLICIAGSIAAFRRTRKA